MRSSDVHNLSDLRNLTRFFPDAADSVRIAEVMPAADPHARERPAPCGAPASGIRYAFARVFGFSTKSVSACSSSMPLVSGMRNAT